MSEQTSHELTELTPEERLLKIIVESGVACAGSGSLTKEQLVNTLHKIFVLAGGDFNKFQAS